MKVSDKNFNLIWHFKPCNDYKFIKTENLKNATYALVLQCSKFCL